MVEKGLSDEVTTEHLKETRKEPCDICGKNFTKRGNNKCKGPAGTMCSEEKHQGHRDCKEMSKRRSRRR
jgi:hypothetical protein